MSTTSRTHPSRWTPLVLWSGGAALLAAAVFAAVALVAQPTRPGQQAQTVTLADSRVAVYNLAGSVDVVGWDGPDVQVEIRRGGADSDRLDVEVDRIEGRQTLRVVYPADRIVYPQLGRDVRTTVRVNEDGTFHSGGPRGFLSWFLDDRVEVQGRGSGLEAWADVVIRVPAGHDVATNLAAGEILAEGVESDLHLHTARGNIRASDIRGFLYIDTGSGRAFVDGVDGDVSVDTGSGAVEVWRVAGDATVDTGSGSVQVGEIRGRRLSVDTGSGPVSGDLLDVDALDVDTGSGGVDLRATTASRIGVDTGSGSVRVELMEAVEDVDVETGSGRVELVFSEDVDAWLDIETGSGGIRSDLAMQDVEEDRNELRARVGSGAGRISVETGSGGVRLFRQ